MNDCVSSQELGLYGPEVVKVAEILMNSFCCDEIFQALIMAADILQENFQTLTMAFLQIDKPRAAPNGKVVFDNIKPDKVRTAVFINRHYIPP